MKITLGYFGQLHTVCGMPGEDLDVAEGTSLCTLLQERATHFGDGFTRIVLDEEGGLRPSILIVLDEAMVDKESDVILSDGQEIRLFTAIAGG